MRRAGIFAALLLFAVPALAADPAAETALDEFNKAARAVYATGRSQMLARTDPVVLVAFDTLILRRKGEEKQINFTPPGYHRLKATAHVALGLYGALAVAEGDQGWKAAITDLRTKALAVRARLEGLDFTPAQVDRQRELIDLSVGYIDRTLAAGRVDQAELAGFGRAIAPLMLANGTEAASLQLDGLHAAFEPWRKQLSPEEWSRLYVLVLGSRMPRDGNLQFSYFSFALGKQALEQQRLVYTEGVTNPEAATRLLATMVMDRGLAEAFFDDRLRMDRDLLADAAQAHLLKMFGRLGRD